MAKSLKAKNLATRLVAADANSIAEMAGNVQSYDSATLGSLAQINTHSYNGSNADRRNLRTLANRAGKRLWQSETGPSAVSSKPLFDVALWSAALIVKDLRELGAEAWIDWQVAGGGVWGVIDYDAAAQSSRMNKKGFAYAQFSRFIRPGAIILGGGDSNTVAAYRPAAGSLVIVVVNESDTVAGYAFDLSRFPGRPASARAYRTSASEDVKSIGPIAFAGSTLAAQVPARSVTTFVMEVATVAILPPSRAGNGGARGFLSGSAIATPTYGTWKGAACVDAAGRLAPPGAAE